MSSSLIIGASGNVGRHVVLQLVARGHRVRVLARRPDEAHLPERVEVVRGDLTLPDTLEGCLEGIDTIFLVWTAPPAAFAPALKRMAKHAQRIVFLSAPLKTPHPFFQQPNPSRTITEQIERLIETSGIQWTFLRPGMFSGNSRLWWAPQIRQGDSVRWPYLSVPTAPIDERDIAAVAVRALSEEAHAGAEYVLTGPQSLSQYEQISIIGRVLGRSLRIKEISPEDAPRELFSIMPESVVKMLLDAWSAAAGQPAFISSAVAEITGTPARTFVEWATDHITDFRTGGPRDPAGR